MYNTIKNRKKECDIVRIDTDDHLKVSPKAVAIIELLSNGKTIQETSDSLKITAKKIIELVKMYAEFGIVEKIDDSSVPNTSEKIKPILTHIDKKYFSWILSKKLLLGFLIFVVFGLWAGLTTKNSFPTYQDFFWTDDLLLVYISLFAIDTILVIFHEAGHFIATKAVGGQARINFGHRFYYVVVETESYHMGIIPKKLRYLIYFSGMMVSVFIVASVLIILKLMDLQGLQSGVLRNLFLVVILVEIKQIIWQFNVYLETDIYNFLSDFFDQENLRSNTKKLITIKIQKWKNKSLSFFRNILLKIFNDSDTQKHADNFRFLYQKEKKQLQIYAVVLIVGIIFSIGQFLYYILPREYVFLSRGFSELFISLNQKNLSDIFKSLLLIILILQRYIILSIVFICKRKHR